MNLVLWIVQGLLAVSCVVSGVLKAFRPLATVSRLFPWTSHVPAALVRVIGVSELLAGIARAYQKTQEALRHRLLPASDVATCMRLSNDSKSYW